MNQEAKEHLFFSFHRIKGQKPTYFILIISRSWAVFLYIFVFSLQTYDSESPIILPWKFSASMAPIHPAPQTSYNKRLHFVIVGRQRGTYPRAQSNSNHIDLHMPRRFQGFKTHYINFPAQLLRYSDSKIGAVGLKIYVFVHISTPA